MKLNLLERFTILQILPAEGNFSTLKINRDLQESLAPTEKEFKDFEIVQEDERTRWNQKGMIEKEIEIGEKATDMIVKSLKKLDEDKKLTAQHISVFEKFVKEN